MDFAKLFPATMQESKEETCTLGKTFSLKDVAFEKINASTIPDATFIDGGSAALFSSPSRCIGIIKVALVNTSGLERKSITAYSYLVSITANSRFLVRSEPLGARNSEIEKSLDGEFLVNETTPEQFLDTLRTLAEYAIAPEGIIVRDGSLRTTNQILQQHCKPTATTVALAKTSQTLTNLSRPLGLALLHRAPQGAWIAQLTDDACCVRLHPASAHVFFVEGNITPETLTLLSAWSSDMTFPGYPYPLVLADQLARVTNNERDAWKIVLVNDREAEKILADEARLSNAHAMLEHILYGKEL